MKRVLTIVLGVLTVALVAGGVWLYMGDEYPFRLDRTDIVGVSYERTTPQGRAAGWSRDLPDDFAAWVSTMEREAAGDVGSADVTMFVALRDGRQLRVDVAGDRAVARWIEADGLAGEAVGVHMDDRLRAFLTGFSAGLRATPREVTTTTASPVP
jgi:hypothetical protein